jgi:hypothetical protein
LTTGHLCHAEQEVQHILLFFLIGFRNRLAVLLNWALSYYSYRRYARIIVSDEF